ncbi:MAG: hypothetical protein MUE85_10495 [Microscillaceae bacterium]|jgi:hypothetical protein|nr:hypothetical protein [Microscillaceae bacterium]
MGKENSEQSTAKIQAFQAIAVALIGALATIAGAYIASSGSSSGKKEDTKPQTETSPPKNQDTSPPPQTTNLPKQSIGSQNTDNQIVSKINTEVESLQNDLKDFLKLVREQKNDFKQKLTQASAEQKYKIKDQILRLEEIEEKIAIDINTLQNWLNKTKLSSQEKTEMTEIGQNLQTLQEELNEL